MKYIHKPIEVEAMKFTLTEAKNPDSLAFSQFGIQDRSKTNSWSYWKTPESLTVPGRFFLRTKQHSTMMVAVGDWVVKDSTGHVTLMDDKRFNELYRAAPAVKSPPQEDWREVIKTSGLSMDKIRGIFEFNKSYWNRKHDDAKTAATPRILTGSQRRKHSNEIHT